ncbi:MAG: cysteine hydrolase [Bacilli bacterium]|nr:cysteine hydrolase [Bacilli bacterium]
MKILLIIDMQNDFVSGALKNVSAAKIVKNIENRASKFKGKIFFTQDTHDAKTYLKTQEGKLLPIKHCIKGSKGWKIVDPLQKFINKNNTIQKPTFGSKKLVELFNKLNKKEKIESITLVGTCTDICVISNAILLKTYFPEIPIIVEQKLCAGTSPKNHNAAILAMKCSQIKVI